MKFAEFSSETAFADDVRSIDPATAASMIADAEARTSELAGRLRALVTERVELILQLAAADDEALPRHARALGAAALEVAEVAGAAGLNLVGSVACGIAALIDKAEEDGVWHGQAVRTHLHALGAAKDPAGLGGLEGELMLARLKAVRNKAGLL